MVSRACQDDEFEKRQKHIQEMEEKLDRLAGGKADMGVSVTCPDEIHEKFLESVLAFEEAEQVTLFEVLAKGGLQLPPPDQLDDERLGSKLWEVIRGMALLGAYLHNTNHLSGRELYCLLWAEVLREPTVLMPVKPDFAQHIDIIGSGSEEDIRLYLRYYADEEERRCWAKDWPDDTVPGHESPPYDRDRLLPRAPF